MKYLKLVLFLLIFCSTQSQEKPSFISFEYKNDSILVFAKNLLACPTHTIINDKKTNHKEIINFKPFEKKRVLKTKKDIIQILKDYKFRIK